MTHEGNSRYTLMRAGLPSARIRGFFRYLESKEYSPQFYDEYDSIYFVYSGLTYCLDLDLDEPELFQIFRAAVWEISNEDDRRDVEKAAAMVMSTFKGIKVVTADSDVLIGLYTFASSDAVFHQIFLRWMEELHSAVRGFEAVIPERMNACAL